MCSKAPPFRLASKHTCLTQFLCSSSITEPSQLLRIGQPQFARIGTLASWISPFVRLPFHRATGSRSSTQEPETDSRPLHTGCRLHSNQVSCRLYPGHSEIAQFRQQQHLTTLQRGFNFVRLSVSHLHKFNLALLTPTLTTTAFDRSRLEWFRPCP